MDDDFAWDDCWQCGAAPEVVRVGYGLPASPQIVTQFFCRRCASTVLWDAMIEGDLRWVRESIVVYELDGLPFDHTLPPARRWEPDLAVHAAWRTDPDRRRLSFLRFGVEAELAERWRRADRRLSVGLAAVAAVISLAVISWFVAVATG